MRYLILVLLPIYITAKSYGLKELIDHSTHHNEQIKKSLTLQIVNHFYTIRSLNAALESLRAESRELKAQIDRVQSFEVAGLATDE